MPNMPWQSVCHDHRIIASLPIFDLDPLWSEKSLDLTQAPLFKPGQWGCAIADTAAGVDPISNTNATVSTVAGTIGNSPS